MGKRYFISGHRDITFEEFAEHYIPIIDKALEEDDSSFVVGDCIGADLMATKYLYEKGADVTVYHMFVKPRFFVKPLVENDNDNEVKLKGGYTSDVHRDYTMTLNSDIDIAWVRKGKERSGTMQNIERRDWLRKRIENGKPYMWEDLLPREANLFL